LRCFTATPTDVFIVQIRHFLDRSLGLGYLALFNWLVTPAPPVGFYWDDGWYLLMAEWMLLEGSVSGKTSQT
jgi:hypothetical protein